MRDPAILFRDTFHPHLADGWSWIRESPAGWRVTGSGLEVHIQPGNMWGPANDAKNVLVRRFPVDIARQPVEVTAAVTSDPTNQWEQVDLVLYYDDSNMVKVGLELVDGRLSVVMGREQNDATRTISITPVASENVQLRYRVDGSEIRGYFKTPTSDWQEVGHCDLPAKGPPRISLQFYRGPADAEHWARVSEVTVRRV